VSGGCVEVDVIAEAADAYTNAVYALPSDLRGAHTSNGSPVRSNNEGSSFSGAFTRVEMGHIVIDADG
jgi:hypothetical protein